MSLFLIEPTIEYQEEYIQMIEEWKATGGRMVSFVLRYDYSDFPQFLRKMNDLKEGIHLAENTVSSSTYWLVNAERTVIGAVNVRHRLNERLLRFGGHIGYGIRPSMRRKGYATELLRLSLLKAKDMNISKVLITCDKDNAGSAKTIMNNGGVLDSEELFDGTEIQRYWITIT